MKAEAGSQGCPGSSCEMNVTLPDNNTSHLLRLLNDSKAELYIPVILYIVVLLVAGVIGNSLVLYVYIKRFKRTSSNYFIMSLAWFDILACCIGMPTEIYDLRYPYMFDSVVACKLFRFSESVPVVGSALILVAVAFDRYFKICKPFKNTRLSFIKKVCIGLGAVSFISTIPTIFVFGLKNDEIDERYPGVIGKDCSVAKKDGKTPLLARIWFVFLTVIFVVCTLTMAALYVRIWLEIRYRQNLALGRQVSKNSTEDSGLPRSPTSPRPAVQPAVTNDQVSRVKYLPSTSVSSDPDSGGIQYTQDKTKEDKLNRLTSNTSDGLDPERKSLRQIGENVMTKIRASKTTVILFAVTLVFILSYLPTLIVTVIKNQQGTPKSDSEDFLMKLFSKSYFINNSVNPIIYSFLNVHFRLECARTLSKLFQCCLCCFKSNSASINRQRPT